MVEYTSAIWLLPMLAVVAILAFGTACWVYRDARRHGSDRAAAWGVATLFLGLVGLAVYLLARRSLEPSGPPTRTGRLVRNVVVAAALTFVVGAAATPPDPFSQASTVASLLPVFVGSAVLYTYRDVLGSAI